MRAAVVVNPVARRASEALEALHERAGACGVDIAMVLQTTPDDLGESQARAARQAGCDVVIACGGDGTARFVAQGLRGSDVGLGVVPLGTANILARNLGMRPGDLRANVAAALVPGGRRMDLGLARLRVDGRWGDELPFFVMAGIGGDASTIGLVSAGMKARLGWAAYFAAGARTALRRPVAMRMAVDGAAMRGIEVWSLLAGNTGTVPPGIELFPGAAPDDGLLHLLEVRVSRPWQWPGIAAAGLVHRRATAPRLVHTAGRQVDVLLPVPQLLQLDGDVFGPVEAVQLSIQPSAIRVAGASSREDLP